ncbi:ribosome biogenesis GTP-binding protein YihA/YsxC [Niveibacterium umoris]|uniref:Probable GTP-binding protein EngB n=1 Tax=Niveibacterium umoris TaxID=1193620 RepID=A0A840BIT2_9RHOO|nr:ribosome biogenesis GTP-binding protein YihA/YsxC [Niveibacterium umoris]MBB4012543.1 GTP-binding protein [Niveibacterium umoris]
MSIFRHARFETSYAKPNALPDSSAPEIAFVGRSNAGKSSAINTLVGHNRLAFVSKTPGRTQLINFFRLPSGVALVDLPGFGYAQVPEPIRRQWQDLLEKYLTRRPNVIGLIHIMDSRHPLTHLDRQLLDWFTPSGRPVHILLTKSDKLTRGPAAQTLMDVRRELAQWGPSVTAQLFSSLKKTGMDDAERVVTNWLESLIPDPDKEKPPAEGEEGRG